ncbi:MAG: hypothetical protein Q8P20_07850 [bacterium]|nr:hypothetical protein [bacterium]
MKKRILIWIMVILVGIIVVALDPMGSFKVNQTIGIDTGVGDYERTICRTDKQVIFTWRNDTSDLNNIHFGFFNTTENTWNTTFDSLAAAGGHSPSIACDLNGTNATIVYHDDTNSGENRPLVMLNTTDSGETWHRNSSRGMDYAVANPIYPQISATIGKQYVAVPTDNGSILFERYNYNVLDFNRTTGLENCNSIDIVSKGGGADSDTVMVFCLNVSSAVKIAKSIDSGDTFEITQPDQLNPSSCSTITDHMSVSYKNDTAIIGCGGGSANQMIMYNSTDNGNIWSNVTYHIGTGGAFPLDLQTSIDTNDNPWFVFEWNWATGNNYNLVMLHHNGTGWNLTNVTDFTDSSNRQTSPRIPVIMKNNMLDIAYLNKSDNFFYYRPYNLTNIVQSEGSTPPPDTTPPQVTINFPQNVTYNFNDLPFNFSVTTNEESTANYSLNNHTTQNMTRSGLTEFNATNSSIADGDYVFYVFANDTANNQNDSESVQFSLDATFPTANIIRPENITYTSLPIEFNITTSENSTVNYSLDGGINNLTMDFSSDQLEHNATNNSIANGGYNVNYYILDGNGNLNDTASLWFSVSVSSGTGGGGGGGGGGGIPKITNETECNINWTCDNWNFCINKKQERICQEVTGCSTEENKPEILRDCTFTSSIKDKIKEIYQTIKGVYLSIIDFFKNIDISKLFKHPKT